jgi:hypothetical protein
VRHGKYLEFKLNERGCVGGHYSKHGLPEAMRSIAGTFEEDRSPPCSEKKGGREEETEERGETMRMSCSVQ